MLQSFRPSLQQGLKPMTPMILLYVRPCTWVMTQQQQGQFVFRKQGSPPSAASWHISVTSLAGSNRSVNKGDQNSLINKGNGWLFPHQTRGDDNSSQKNPSFFYLSSHSHSLTYTLSFPHHLMRLYVLTSIYAFSIKTFRIAVLYPFLKILILQLYLDSFFLSSCHHFTTTPHYILLLPQVRTPSYRRPFIWVSSQYCTHAKSSTQPSAGNLHGLLY